MARHILMVGRSAASLRNLEADLLAMYDDVVISEVNNVRQAEFVMTKNAIHLIIYLLDDDDRDGLAFCAKLAADSELPPCLLLAGAGNADLASQQGIENILTTPYAVDKLAVVINRVCNPVDLRQFKRYSIPQTTAIIRQRDFQMNAEVLNVSYGGVLCEFMPHNMFRISDPVMIDLQFTTDRQEMNANKIYASPSSMKVIERNADYTHLKIRAGIKFITVPVGALDILRTIFQNADLGEEEI